MNATSPFYRAVTPAVREKGLGRRTVLVDAPSESLDVPMVPEEAPAVAESAEVAGEHANRSGATYAETIRRRYGEWLAAGAVGLDPIAALDPAHECPHGKLPEDRTQTCNCWRPGAASDPNEEASTMQLVADPQVQAANEAAGPSAPGEAIRLRRDGRPDGRYTAGGRSTRAIKAKKSRPRAAAPVGPVKSGPAAAPESPTLAWMVGRLDHEIEALQRARAALLEAAS